MLNKGLILVFMTAVIGYGLFCLNAIPFEDDLSGLRLASEKDVKHYKTIDSSFTQYPESTILILENEAGWENYQDYLVLDSITRFATNLKEVKQVSSLTNLYFPKKALFTISWDRFVNLESEKSFNNWRKKKGLFPDINQKFISENSLYTIIYLESSEGLGPVSIASLKNHSVLMQNKTKAYIVQNNLTQAIIESNFKQESLWLAIICIVFILLAFYIFTKSLLGLGLIGFFVAFNISATAIFMVVLNISFNVQMIALPCLLIIFSFTDIMHIIYHQTLLKEASIDDKVLQKDLKSTLKTPILLTSISNIFSFIIYFLVSDNEQLSNLAIISIIGVSVAYLSSSYLVIPLLSKKQFFIQTRRIAIIQGTISRVIELVKVSPKQILLPLILLSGFIFFLNFRAFKIDTGKADAIVTNPDLIKSQDILSTHFYGSKSLDILTEYKHGSQIWDVKNLRKTEQLENFLDSLLNPLYIISPVTIMKRYHRFTVNGNPNAYLIPKQISKSALAVLEADYSNLGGGQVISKDQTKTRITIGFKDPGLFESRIAYSAIRNYLKKQTTPNFNLSLSGLHVLADEGIYGFTRKVLAGWTIAILLSAFLLAIYLRSFLKGLIFLLVNILPLLVVLLLMPYLGLKINPQSLFLLTILVGLCLDDSIYLLVNREKAKKGLSLYPILVTSIVLAAGFIAFGFSSFSWLSPFAWIFLIGILIALGLDLFILPLFMVENKEKK